MDGWARIVLDRIMRGTWTRRAIKVINEPVFVRNFKILFLSLRLSLYNKYCVTLTHPHACIKNEMVYKAAPKVPIIIAS